MKKTFFPYLLIAFVFFSLVFFKAGSANLISAQGANWHLSGWSYRYSFTLFNAQPNMLVYIKIPEDSQIFSKTKEKGEDLRVVDDKGTSLPFVIKEWSKKQRKGLVVAKLLNPSSSIYLYTNNPVATDAQQPAKVYLVYDDFSNLSRWSIVKNPQNVSLGLTKWIPAWATPLAAKNQTLNIGPGAILNDNTIIATTIDTGEIKKSFDLGKTWQTVPISYPANSVDPFDKSKSPHDFISRFFFKDSQGNLYTSFDGSEGIFRSPDNGQTWTKVLDFSPYINCCPSPSERGCWQSCCDKCSSLAQLPCSCGKSFEERLTNARQNNSYGVECFAGLEDGNCVARYCTFRCSMGRSVTEFSNGVLLAGSYSGGSRNNAGVEKAAAIFKSTDHGLNWTKVWSDPQGRHVHFVAADPYHLGRAYAAVGDGVLAAKIIKTEDFGNSWVIIKNEKNPQNPSAPPYWQPTAVVFTPECRLFGGDNEFDPVIHRSCDGNEENFEVVLRLKNNYGYFYWANTDSQANHYFGFLSNPNLAREQKQGQLHEVSSFIMATPSGAEGDFWQIISCLGKYPTTSVIGGEGLKTRRGTIGSSNFLNNISFISTIENRPYLLQVESNQTKKFLKIEPESEVRLNLPSLENYKSLLLEFTFAMKSSKLLNQEDRISPSETLSLVDNNNQTIVETLIMSFYAQPDLWYVYTNGTPTWTGQPFFLNTWTRFQYFLDLANNNWKLCLPDYNFCTPNLKFGKIINPPLRLVFKSNGFISKSLMDLSIGAYWPDINIANAVLEESAPPLTPTPTSNPCPNGDVGNLDCDPHGKVNDPDLTILSQSWAPTGPVPPPSSGKHTADLNNDGKVDEIDLTILLKNWNN